jgi:antitoxin component of MazEF toxin-antitoxin module
MDQKMRVRIPKHISRRMGLKGSETLNIDITEGEIRISKPRKMDASNDPILRDMIERPMHSKIKITGKLLEKWEKEMWSS